MAATTTARIAQVRLPTTGIRHQLRATSVVWRRELVRFSRDRTRMLTGLVQPLLFLFVLGTGLSSLVARGTDLDFRTFLYPGIVAISVLFTATFAGISLVWDREWGFLREMMVAPVRRSSIVVGMSLGGATIASLQGLIVLALAPLADVPYDPVLLLGLLALMLLLAFTVTASAVLAASRIKQLQAFTAVMQMLVMPLFFLSGALFPLSGLPTWLNVLNRLDPLTYAVDPMRRLVFDHVEVSASARETVDPGVTWFGWHVPALLEITIVLLLGLVMLALAIRQFSRTE